MSTSKLSPSYYGYVGSTKDALLIIQEILDKQLELVPRRPHERERASLIKSGNVFVFIEEHSGIKRWTDGIAWSPSRILGRFLVYRELDKHSLSEKDDKKKKKRKVSVDSDQLDNNGGRSGTSSGANSVGGSSNNLANSNNSSNGAAPSIPHAQQLLQHHQLHQNQNNLTSNTNTSSDYNKNILGGPLVTSYVFKDQGLIKKTLSLTTTTKDLHIEKSEEKQTIHLISYYNADDVLNGKLQRPSETDLKNLNISNSLWNAVKDSSLGGKIPIEDEAYYFLDTNYQLQNMSLLQQPPQIPVQQHHPQPQAQQSAGIGGPPPTVHQQQHQQQQQQQQRQSHGTLQYYPSKYGPPPHQQYMLPVPQQQNVQPPEYSQQIQPQGFIKREEDSNNNTNNGNVNNPNNVNNPSISPANPSTNSGQQELTFIDPFTGAAHQTTVSYNGGQPAPSGGSAPGSTAGTSIPLFNNYMISPQQFAPQYMQQGHSQVQQKQGAPSQHESISANSSISHYPPFPQHFQTQHLYSVPGGPQYHFGSVSASSDQYSMGGASNGSISSIASSALYNSSNNSFSGPAGVNNSSSAPNSGKSKYRNSSASASSTSISGPSGMINTGSGWFTTNPPIGGGGYISAPPPMNAGELDANGVPHYPGVPHHHPGHNHHMLSHPLARTTTSVAGSTATVGVNDDAGSAGTATAAAGAAGPYNYSSASS
ncbi:gluconate transport-inducing protein required for gluconate-H+ symport [Scheffersomyces xylosifermentans]|uniref:gluconate transport-inducing protein required for gluconate-H+ symport n=1 Tax=Scheffersomyces xylosifermentans TaxID=1304137 RepID=UPI00315D6CE1